ncbi:SOS response-associated peptidase [Niallia taxi]|nr:SOS response-associated peptidase [Niallia taxi]MDE5055349.1 SOS response-associated peptidase [Niallia taxi]
MCGRFSLIEELEFLQEEFEFEFSGEITPRYNISPGQDILAVGFNKYDGRVGNFLKWGLVPSWAKEPKIGYKLINARMETVDQKPSFKQAFQKRRCLILSSGFYEWKKTEEGKQPFRFVMQDKRPFAFAGLYEVWNNGEGQPLATCTIITTNPNEVTKDVHDRMPVILKKEGYDIWLNPDNQDTELLKGLLKPYEAEEMMKYEVSTLVNSPKNEGEALFAPINSI